MQRDDIIKKTKNLHHPNEKLVKTHCSYCGMQCGMNLRVDTTKNEIIGVEPRYDWPVTLGKMCPKGVTAYQQTKDRKSTRLNSSHVAISYAVFCLKKNKQKTRQTTI